LVASFLRSFFNVAKDFLTLLRNIFNTAKDIF